MKNTTYLYDRENRDVYQDYLAGVADEECIFSRNIPAYLNSRDEQKMPFMANHILTCPVCQKKLQEQELLNSGIQSAIPLEEPGEHFFNSIETGLSDVRKLIQDKVSFKKEMAKKKRVSFAKDIILDFTLRTLISRSFLQGGVIALVTMFVMYLLLKP